MSDRRMPTYEDFLRQEMRNIPQPDPEPTSDQGVIGDTVDMFQRGVGQTFGGDAETLGQLTDSQTIKNAGRAISDWGEGQMQEVSPEMRAAMAKQFVVENPDGSISAGDAWADPRAYWGNFATVLGQFTGLIGGTKGAGVVAKPLIRGMANRLATDLVEGEAKRLVAKATVKDALKSGTMDSVRAAYAAAPTAVAKKAVIDKAVGQLAFIGMGAHAGAMAAGMRAQQAERDTRTYLNSLSPDVLNSNAAYQDAYWSLADGDMNGAAPDEIRKAAISYLSEQTASDAFQDPRALASDFASGLLTGAGGGIGGALGKVGQTRTGAAVRGFVGEGATEGWQGAETQRAVNEAVQEWADETRDPMAGVLVAGLNEAIVGSMAGGGLAGVVGPEVHINKPVVRTVTGNERIDQGIGHLDQRQAERGAAIEREIDTLFAGKQNPLGASGQVFDPVRDIPAYERQGFVRGSHDFRGTEIPGPLEGELLPPETGLMPLNDSTDLMPQGGRAAQDLAELAGGRMPPSGRQAVTDQRLDGDLMPQELGPERAGLPGATIEGDGREVGTELPYRDFIVGEDGRQAQRRAADIQRRGRELADQPAQIGQSDTIFVPGEPGADPRNSAYTPPRLSRDQVDRSMGEESTRDPRSPVSQAIANAGSATDSVFGPLQSMRVTKRGKPFASQKEAQLASRADEQPVALNGGGFGIANRGEVEQAKAADQVTDFAVRPTINVSGDSVTVPSSSEGEASQPHAEVRDEQIAPVSSISGEGQSDQPGAGVPTAAGAGPAVAGLTDRAGSGDRADLAAPAPVPDGQQQNDPTLTAPATDAGAAVSGRIGEEELRDRDLLKEHGGHWKYRSAVGAGWFTANTKEAAIERAEEAYRKAVSKGEPVPTRDERFAQADAELFSEMDRRYGKMSTPELEAEYQRLGGEVGDLQKSGSGEFNGNGGRRTGAAVSNEGARQVGEERLRLGVYMKMRRDRDTAGSGAKSQQIEPANDWRGAKSATDYHAAKRRLFSGEMEFSEFQAMSRSALDNAPSLRAELEKKTKQDLLDQMSRFNAARYKNDKKAVVVEAAYNQLIGDLRWAANGDGNTISETYAIGGARQSIEERVAKALDGLTPERYQQFVNKQRADVAKRDAELAATKEALRDPQTLEQFKTFLKYRSLDKLTPEQRAHYEDLIAASNLDKRDQAREVKAATAVTPTASGDIIKTKHTKSGEDLFVVQMGDRVDRDTYNQINAHAKKLGGWYSSYKVGGAVPGFQFKDEAKATEFRGWLTGQGAASAAPSAEAAPTEVTDPDQDNSKSKQVETLRTRAKTLRDKATAALNAERKENTNKRMTEAANARANAESELHFAGLLDAIADGIESGEVTYLRNLANGTQLTELNHALSRSLWNLPPARREALTSQGMIERTEDGRERWSAKATPEMMAEGAQMPGMDYFARNLKDVATKMQGASGFKQAGAKIMALVNAAINRDSKTVSITDPELIAKLKAYTSGVSDYDAKAVKEQIDGYSRLERMGITNHTELRAALRELARLQAGLKKQAVPRDPLAEKMVALKRKLVGNRNAFIDFFPTPESHAADLVALAGIEPGMTVLEPSAGHGMLAEAARAAGAKVDAVELAGDLREILQAKGFGLVGSDFMATTPAQSYDAVVMNPPFSDDMDIDHVRHAYDHLKPGGRLVAIVSATAGDRQNNKNKAFREWFDGLGGSEQAMPEGSFKASLNPTDVRTKIFVIDKPANEAKPLPSPEGKRVTVATPKGQSVEVQYRVMEAADLVASHDFEGNLNHDYPQQLQPRDRSKQTYRVQVGQIAAAPDGARLAASPETDRGAPIVRDGIVESGNGRSIGLRQAYQRGDADAYRRYIEANAADFGIDPAVIGAMKQPVLVRERITTMTDDQLRDFVVDSNTDAKMANSAAEDAGADAGKLTDDMLDLLNIPEGGDVLASQNNRFLQAFLSAIGKNQSNSYVSRDGQWNDAYRKRVTAAIFAYGYDNQRLLDAATGEVDADGRNITTALINNAVGMAKLRQHSPERAKVISNYLAEAVESIARAKRSGQSLQEMAAQSDMLGGDTSPEGSLLAQAIAASARSAKAITGMVGDILTMLNKTTSADMFGAAVDPATPETAINETLKAISAYNQQKASQPKPGGDLFGLAGARNNHGAAPSVPRSGDASAAKGAGGVTEGRLELDGVSIRIPAIDEEQQRLYNQATHRGQGVNFASGISTGVGRILNDLKDAGLLDTAEQRAAAEAEVQAWANEEAINARKLMRDGIKNPSWAITGRSGRKAQSSAAQDAENRRQAAHHKDQSDRITALRGELKKLRPKEVIGKESFNYAWGKAKGMIADYASAQSNGQPNLLASLRKSMNAELARYLQSMGKIDAPNFIKTLKEQDQRLKAAGHDGLVAIVGARSNPGKIISDAINGRIRFSKQAMAQGEKPAKHLTRKEAELVTKEWFKQYRGASGIDVQIHATQAELEKALGLAAQDGLIRRAAFDDDSGTLHVAADTIANPKRMREILRHEVLAHYGLANVLGDGEYTKLMSRLIQSQKDPSMKPVWDWVNTHYADEDIGTQAEEVVAHLAELEQGAWGRGWDRVVAWVTRALRAVGFVPDGITAAETRSLIEGLGKKLQRSGPDDSGPDGGKKFSQEAERPAQKGGIKMSQASTAADAAMEKLNLGPKPDIIDKTKTSLNKLRQVDRGVVSSWVDRVIKKANTEVLDALAPIKYAEEAAGITDAADSGYVAARMATGAASTMQATMLYGLPEWRDGVIQHKEGTGEKDALLGIFSDLGKDLHNWLGWMAGHRAELLMEQGRENLLSEQDIAALKGLGKGKEAKFMEAKARWNRLNAATLDLAQEAGLFTPEARAEFESEWYIPFFRESDDGDVIAPFKPKGIANQNAGIKKLKGGEANTNDLLENIFTSTSKLIDASMKNMAAQKTVWNLADTGLIDVVAKPNMMDWRALKNGKDLIAIKMDGEDYMIRVNDPDLYRAMTFFDRQPFGAMVNVAAKAKRLLTAGVTASPEFMLRNFLRDSLSSWAISKDGFKPVIDSIKGVKKTLAMEGSTLDVMFSGASFLGGYVNGNDPTAMADSVRKALRRKGMTPEQIAKYEKSIVRNAAQVKGIVADAWDQYSRYGEALENANREAVYEAAIKAGKSHAQAAFESKDLMDFSMLGAARFIQVASMVLPFFNARIQGLGKLSRELRDNPREIAKRAGMITAMSLGLLALNWDDERYEELPDWDKDANWHFFIGDQHFRIPKPFEIGVMFGTIPERMVRAMGGKDTGAQFGKAVARAVGETFALNPTPQIVKPLVESYFNYDAFRGGPIENAQDLAVQAEARYNEQTSLMMRELGDTLGMSPKKLEHLLIGYTGTMGSYVMAAADGLIRASRPGESASWRADEIPLVKAVYRGTGPAKSTQHMEEFYRMLNEVNQLKRTVDQYRSEGLTDKANELLKEQGGILKSRRSLSQTQQQVRVVRNKIELIQRDRTMSADEKRRRIDGLLSRRNDLVYQAVNKNRQNWE
ncbi:LPD38 domain-containing protein [Aeromonas caviae]